MSYSPKQNQPSRPSAVAPFPATLPAETMVATSSVPLDLRLRPARIGDLLSLYRACYNDRPLAQFRDSFQRALRAQAAGSRVFLIAEKRDSPVGSGQIIAYNHKIEIADLIVAEPFRDQGIGTAIIEVLVRLAHFTQFEEVEIGVMAANDRALALYRKLGFTPVRELQLAGEARAIILRKSLESR